MKVKELKKKEGRTGDNDSDWESDGESEYES